MTPLEQQDIVMYRAGPDVDLKLVQLSQHFTLAEFKCHCLCCPFILVSKRLVAALEQIRTTIGMPIHITNGHRCQKHNADVGGSWSSRHTVGQAVDFTVQDRGEQSQNITAAYETARLIPEIGGIGKYLDKGGRLIRLHIDVRAWSGSAKTIWTKVDGDPLPADDEDRGA